MNDKCISNNDTYNGEILTLYEDPKYYDGYIATIYKDGNVKLRRHPIVDKLPKQERLEIIKKCKQIWRELNKKVTNGEMVERIRNNKQPEV